MKSESSKSNYLNESELKVVKMFYKVKLEHSVTLEPRHFGPKLFDVVKQRLYEEVEGKCFDTHGMIIAVIEIEVLGDGFLFSGEAGVTFHVTFRALVARPFRDQVVDGNVSMVRTSKPEKPTPFSLTKLYTSGDKSRHFREHWPVPMLRLQTSTEDRVKLQPQGESTLLQVRQRRRAHTRGR